MPRYEVSAYIQVEAAGPAEAFDTAVAALEYMSGLVITDGAIVDFFVDLEPDQVEP